VLLFLSCTDSAPAVGGSAFDIALDGVWSTSMGSRSIPMLDAPPELRATRALVLPDSFDPSTRVTFHAMAMGWRARVSLNGQLIGMDTGGIRPLEIDLTGKLAAGSNPLELYLEAPRPDNIVLGRTILAPAVFTYSAPRRDRTSAAGEAWLSISSLRNITDLDVTYDAGTLNASATVDGADGERVHFRVVRDGAVLADLGMAPVKHGTATASGPWSGPLWTLGGSPEPFLQYLVATLPDGTARQVRFGARSVARHAQALTLNGTPTYLAVQRHDPARADVRADLAAAAAAYSAAGLNSFELHGALHSGAVLDAADELGFPAVLTPRCDGRRRDDGMINVDDDWATFIQEGNERIVASLRDHPSVVLWNLEANGEPRYPLVYYPFAHAGTPAVDLRESQGYSDQTYATIRAGQPLLPYLNELAFRPGIYNGMDLEDRLAPLLREHRSFGIGTTLPHVVHSANHELSTEYAKTYSTRMSKVLGELDVPAIQVGERRGPAFVDVSVTDDGVPSPGAVVLLRAPGQAPIAAATDATGTAHLVLDYAGPATVEVWGGPSTPVTLTPGRYRSGTWVPSTAVATIAR
jgi:hypothetical protein